MLFQFPAAIEAGIAAGTHLLEGTCSAGHLRRQECVWAIEQAIITTFQVQGEQVLTVSDRLLHLQDKIRQDSLTVIERCESEMS
jgi:hypothetical protein